MRIARGFALASVALAAVGCELLPFPFATDPPGNDITRALEANADRWAAAGIADYRFTIEQRCFCPPTGPADIIVEDGVPTSITRDGQPVLADDVPATTVPELFSLARQAAQGDAVTIEYDPATGVPLLIDADPALNAVDEEYVVQVTGFEPLR